MGLVLYDSKFNDVAVQTSCFPVFFFFFNITKLVVKKELTRNRSMRVCENTT